MSLSVSLYQTFPGFTLDVDFTVPEGILGILGPSGCGKSMTLRYISGVERPQRGKIVLDDRTLFDSRQRIDLPPQKRRAGHLFQNYALFPHMTLEQNLLCGIDKRDPDRRNRLEQLLAEFRLTEFRNQKPGQLSGGQQQRGALARCLASWPSLLLLDEPFSALDSYLKTALQLQLKQRLEQFEGPAILVTHDRDEAYLLCDSIAIMEEGRILTIGEKAQVFRHPGTPAAARLTGCKNVVRARKMGEYRVQVPEWGCELPTREPVPDHLTAIGVRAHDFVPASGEGPGNIPVVMEQLTEFPFEWNAIFRTEGGGSLHWKVSKGHLYGEQTPQAPAFLHVPGEKILLLTG